MNAPAKQRRPLGQSAHLMRRLAPYFRPYVGVMALDLFCASLTTICDLVLPLIVRYITSAANDPALALTVSIVLRLGALYLALRIIDAAANYFM